MMSNNPIAAMLTKIRNANFMFHEKVSVSLSKIKLKIIEALKKEGFIKDFQVLYLDKKSKNKKVIIVYLKYDNVTKERVIIGLKRVSKYVSLKKIPKVSNGLGIALISTSKGILTDHEARLNKVGGEVLAYIW
ncbi:30S ribosomal protein S8 [Texas Phoenix palm phytoplasma]|uniref:Small ribosomal subunit protein uS8 n=1 Tax=Texas Phoenix palm phytoplasma TaxID=176709 RepID=A0ABS5BIK4_9MOLU|nr:30S ribosomal protein S8 [Texas Phoenix palm phytoplasma]MBP3059405.1 30S ribosomal protein S8 [Texas Phoenix palm phytoplasma]